MRYLIVIGLLCFGSIFSPSIFAESQDECAIWICAPAGFPSGCGGAHSAMVDRVKDGKSPLPSFSSCAEGPSGDNGRSQMGSDHGIAAYVPGGRQCVSRNYYGNDGQISRCESYESGTPGHVKGTSCMRRHHDGQLITNPKGCTRTDYWVEVFIDGEMAGPTYYFNP